jgi:hypothetical protein
VPRNASMSSRRARVTERHVFSFALIALISATLDPGSAHARGLCQRWLQSFAPKLVTSVRTNVKSTPTMRHAKHVPRVAERVRKHAASRSEHVDGRRVRGPFILVYNRSPQVTIS